MSMEPPHDTRTVSQAEFKPTRSREPPQDPRAPEDRRVRCAGIAIGLLGLITFANVVVRYLTDFSFAFTEEFSVFLMVVVTLVGGSSVMAKNGHLRITLPGGQALPPERRRVIEIWSRIVLTTLMFLLLAIFGTRMAWDEYRFEVTSPGLGHPHLDLHRVAAAAVAGDLRPRALGVHRSAPGRRDD